MNIRKFSIKNIGIRGLRNKSAILGILFVFVATFILYPMVMIVVTSFNTENGIGLDGYQTTFSNPATYKALLNTLRMEIGVLCGTWIIGGFLAFIRHQTDYMHKKFLDTVVFLSFTIPAYILSVSWTEIMSRGGYLNRLIRLINPSAQYSFNAYTISACALVLSLHLYPLVYFGVGNALKMLDGSLGRSARACGVKHKTIVFKIILPLVFPSFISTGLLVIGRSMANFGVPAQLCLPMGEEVMTTRVFSAMADLNLPVVAVLSIILVIISYALFALSERAIGKTRYSLEIQNTTAERELTALGKWHLPVRILIGVFFFVSIVIPYTTIFISSFFKRWGLPLKLQNLTFGNYIKLFTGESLIVQPMLNSFLYGVIASIIAALVASLIVYFYKYRPNTFSGMMMKIAQLPVAVPNMILAVAATFAFINEPLKLYGKASIIVVTYTVLFIPICIKQMLGASKNLDKSLDMAAETAGIPMIQRFTVLFLPAMRSSVASGLILCFLISLKEIPISLLLYTAGTKTLGVLMFTIQSNSYGLEMTSAVSVVIIILSVIGNLILNKFGKRGEGHE